MKRPDLHISVHPNGFILGTNKNAMKTRGGVPITVPTRALAEVLKIEWDSAEKDAPFYALTCFALDALLPNRAERIVELLHYLETDTLRYHSPEPELLQRQRQQWEPALKQFEAAFALLLPRTTGILPLERLGETQLSSVQSMLDGLEHFSLTGLYQAVQVCHSFVLGWLLWSGKITADEAFALAYLEESYQNERWGRDGEAEKARFEKIKLLKNIDSWFCSLRER